MGFKKALKLIKENDGNIKTIVHILETDKCLDGDSRQYLADFERAVLTFKHQVIYDPDEKRQKYLSEILPCNYSDQKLLENFGII